MCAPRRGAGMRALIRRPAGAQSNGSFGFRGLAPPANFRCASGAELRVESLITSRTFSFNFVSNVIGLFDSLPR